MCQSPEDLAQLLERALVKAFPKMSDLERDELKISGPYAPPPNPPNCPHADCRVCYVAIPLSFSCLSSNVLLIRSIISTQIQP